MTKVLAGITTSVDGFITGPNDRAGQGLTIIIAPTILGGGKLLFDGFTKTVELEHLGVRQSWWATFVDYRVKR